MIFIIIIINANVNYDEENQIKYKSLFDKNIKDREIFRMLKFSLSDIYSIVSKNRKQE